MNAEETKAVLALLYTATGRAVPDMVKKLWAELLQPVPFELGMLAAKRMIRLTRIYGEPQFADYREHVNHLHREAKRALRPRKALDAAVAANMTPEAVARFDARNKPSEIPADQAKRIVEALYLEAKRIPGQKTPAELNQERRRQQQMIEDLRVAKDRSDNEAA